MRPIVAAGVLVAAGAWFVYLGMLALRGESIGVFGWDLRGRQFRHAINGWGARVALFALLAIGAWMIYSGIAQSFTGW